MRPLTGGRRELFRRLAAMPFLDRLEMAALSGWSQSAVYEAARRLEDDGLIASVPHGTELVAPTRRFHLTADGLRRLAQEEDLTPDRLLRSYPLAARWRRVLLERLDAVAVIYRLASAVANIHHPIRFRWFRAMPMDAAIILPDGRTIGIVRQGHATDRTGFSKRIGRLRDGPQPGGNPLNLRAKVVRRTRGFGTPATFPICGERGGLPRRGRPIPPGSLAEQAARYGTARYAQDGGGAAIARPVIWTGKLAKVVVIAVPESYASVLGPQLLASDMPGRRRRPVAAGPW